MEVFIVSISGYSPPSASEPHAMWSKATYSVDGFGRHRLGMGVETLGWVVAGVG